VSEQAESIIVIKKKKAAHGGHHGGAWKVAYADFVTAMMSLFIVLWLTSSNDAVKKSVAGYFNDPKGTANRQGSNQMGVGHALPLSKADMPKLKERLLQSAREMPHFDKLRKQIEISASPDGLRIELMEDPGGTFFELGSAQPTPALQEFLTTISRELGKMPNKISIEGHTDSVPYSAHAGYSNWELSTDRANAARRLMQSSGIGGDQIAQVRGFADQLPRRPEQPQDPSNRRITVIVDAGPVLDAQTGGEGNPSEDSQAGAEGQAKHKSQTASEEVAEVKQQGKREGPPLG
jgi:chemotaxis protein MotB